VAELVDERAAHYLASGDRRPARRCPDGHRPRPGWHVLEGTMQQRKRAGDKQGCAEPLSKARAD